MSRYLFLWWLAIVSQVGEAVIMEYRTHRECEIVRSAYERVKVTVTNCIEKTQPYTGKEHTL